MDNEPIFGQIILQILLILLNAVFACAEIAIISTNDNKLAHLAATGNKKAVRLAKLTSEPSKFLATIQVGITLMNLLGSAFAADNFSGLITKELVKTGIGIPASVLSTISLVVITLVLMYFTVTLGELIPKRIGMKNAEKIALSLSGFISFIAKIFAPIVWLLTVSSNGVLKLLGIDPNEHDSEVTEEEIRMMVDAGSEKGTIQPDEKDMIQNIFEFNDKTAEEVMTHRTEVSLLWLEENDEQWRKTIEESKHSIYPICAESPDKIVGILYVKDYFRLKNKSREGVIANAARPPYFVPETVKADLLFRNMKKSRNHFAIVLDEYGGMSGIITMYDLLEQLVGDFDDDITTMEEAPLIERIDSKTWRINGAAPIDDVAQQLNIELPDDYETFGGFVFGILGSVPDDGSTPEIEEFGLVIKVTNVKGHRLESAVVYTMEKESDTDNPIEPSESESA